MNKIITSPNGKKYLLIDLILLKSEKNYSLQKLSNITGIPKSTLGLKTKGYNSKFNFLNTIYRDHIKKASNKEQIRNWAKENITLLGDNGGYFINSSQESYRSKVESREDIDKLKDYLDNLRGNKEKMLPDLSMKMLYLYLTWLIS